jgi:hypothetical protein
MDSGWVRAASSSTQASSFACFVGTVVWFTAAFDSFILADGIPGIMP